MFKCIIAIIQMSDNNKGQIIKIHKAACMIYFETVHLPYCGLIL